MGLLLPEASPTIRPRPVLNVFHLVFSVHCTKTSVSFSSSQVACRPPGPAPLPSPPPPVTQPTLNITKEHKQKKTYKNNKKNNKKIKSNKTKHNNNSNQTLTYISIFQVVASRSTINQRLIPLL